jgi:hypothetical protein
VTTTAISEAKEGLEDAVDKMKSGEENRKQNVLHISA